MSDDELPATLCHYTSQQGLLGIMKDKRMWATHIFYLNDHSEYTYAAELIVNELKDRINTLEAAIDREPSQGLYAAMLRNLRGSSMTPLQMTQNDFFSLILRVLGTKTWPDIYVLSFTEKENDLNQWRSYCPSGMGYCLHFNAKKMNAQVSRPRMKIYKCLYNKEEQIEIVGTIIDGNFEKIRKIVEGPHTQEEAGQDRSKDIDDLVLDTVVSLLSLFPRLKHGAFIDETEWRFVFHNVKNGIQYREGRSMITPFIEVPLATGGEPISAIERIIVGPTPHPELSIRSVESLLKENNISNCEVLWSKIPFRSW